jgi:integrase
MTVLFNHANLWEFTDRNPIFGPNKGLAFGRVQGGRASLNILEVSEIQSIVAELHFRERVLLFLDIATGLRRGEMAGVKGARPRL